VSTPFIVDVSSARATLALLYPARTTVSSRAPRKRASLVDHNTLLRIIRCSMPASRKTSPYGSYPSFE
jgi:hypothetical protein